MSRRVLRGQKGSDGDREGFYGDQKGYKEFNGGQGEFDESQIRSYGIKRIPIEIKEDSMGSESVQRVSGGVYGESGRI